MGYKSILVNLSGAHGHPYALATAIAVARACDAHLEGIYVYEPPYYRYEFAYGAITADLEAQDQKARDAAEEAVKDFRNQAQQAGLQNVEWFYTSGDLLATLTRRSHAADLVITEQLTPETDETHVGADLPADLAIACGCPVLVVPRDEAATAVPKRILIAWNGSRESARAVLDALPLLTRAEAVQILVAPRSTDEMESSTGREVQRLLRHHGVDAQIEQVKQPDAGGAAHAIIGHAHAFGAELICMGAYGHSRLREIVLGGVTWRMLRRSALPLLMSH